MIYEADKKKLSRNERNVRTGENSFDGLQLVASKFRVAEMPPEKLHQSFLSVDLRLGAAYV
jgi:hypothetical protein